MYNVNQLVLDIIENVRLVTLFLIDNKFQLFNLSLTIFEAFLHQIHRLLVFIHSIVC